MLNEGAPSQENFKKGGKSLQTTAQKIEKYVFYVLTTGDVSRQREWWRPSLSDEGSMT